MNKKPLVVKIPDPWRKSESEQMHQRGKLAQSGVDFYDTNALMQDSPLINESIYVDRVHFNDAGYFEMARLINQHIGDTHE
ncbi:Uncharacterised protein [Yersinia intermedia]|jgi:lysophospholipase L1-like esterase|uniref:hypothetical protein n=1 Tax=Yersinia intermedia TaxID=631 RepID=UPI0005AD335A|nr:hypothetical protein [Yersinia intermedia]AJJ20775.1 hypothetical protein CH53_2464 [Yersinia intermedia]MDA5513805.1 hypothetical protein [Yersinia intermedia]CNI78848.1 Uncharacterised protein [Yersinia intermedia]CNI85090.1 Uncharacterised protein [Yersinia intermedia]CQE05722.1 Uncharacterised protein [Yersinia intermedia]